MTNITLRLVADHPEIPKPQAIGVAHAVTDFLVGTVIDCVGHRVERAYDRVGDSVE